MNRDNTPFGPTTAPALTWTAENEPFSTRFDDLYYSQEDGLAEGRHVFLAGNQLPGRWQHHREPDFRIAETGFGTGLNFLLTWQAWRQKTEPRPRLHYVSVEKYPLDQAELTRALAPWKSLLPLAQLLAKSWPGRIPGQHRLCFDGGQVVLDLWWEDAGAALADLARNGPLFDAWYLDGFAPARNESMWQSELYQSMSALSRPDATVATFTAAGHVRRGLIAAGFEVSKVAGFGRKRESLAGLIRQSGRQAQASDTPWDLSRAVQARPRSVLVVGAGLAGCTLARALAERGVSVKLLDRGVLAGEASGNEQGILYTRLSRKHSSLTDFALLSFTHAAQLYRSCFDDGALRESIDGSLCGSFHQQADSADFTFFHLTEQVFQTGRLS